MTTRSGPQAQRAPARIVAGAQTVPTAGDVEANVAQHLDLIRAAEREGVQMLAFPELSLTGYELPLAERLAFVPDDARLDPLRTAARTCAITLVVGAPIRLHEKLHIGAFLIAPDGGLEVYTKHQLGAFSSEVNPRGSVPPPEATVFVPGTCNPLIRRGDWVAAVGICAESLGPTHPQTAAGLGADTYLACHFGIPLDVGFRLKTLQAHARTHRMTVVFANYGGPTGGLGAGGRSAIWAPDGEPLTSLGDSGVGLVVACRDAGGFQGTSIALP